MASVNFQAASPYVAGSLTLAPNVVVGLLDLIRDKLDSLCPGGVREMRLFVRSGGNVYVGAFSKIAGPLSANNFGYSLSAGDHRVYQSSYPGSNVPLGHIQLLADSSSVLNVEVQS